jgi:hypothetical protein
MLFPSLENNEIEQDIIADTIGPQHIEIPLLPCLVVVTEDFQWEFIQVNLIVELKPLEEEWEVTYFKEGSRVTITGAIKYLK